MEQSRENHEHPGHIIDIPDTGDVATSGSSSETTSNHETTASTNAQAPVIRSSSASSTNNLRSPSHYKILVSIKLMYKLSLIIASTIVLANSRHEKPQNPLFNWILCYTIGCLASVPIIFRHCFLPHPWLSRLVDRYRWLLEFFFAFWFIVGNYWVFGEKSSSEAPNLYRFCIVLLVFNYINYIGPPILVTMILCCCRGVVNQIERAPTESINALPTYKFKLNKSRSCSGSGTTEEVPQGGVLAAGTEKERTLLGEDAVCCICLANYDDNDELKELPCSHLFHVSCVDKWLKNKGFCPLCRAKVCKSEGEPSSTANASQQV